MRTLVVLALVASTSALAAGQSLFRDLHPVYPNPDYNGQFTFVRLRYGPPLAMVSQRIPWSHDYPEGERHFMQMIDELTYIKPRLGQTSILALDDVTLGHYPVAYMAEAGFWRVTDSEAAAFRDYLLKGGFVIFDDFAEDRGGWGAFESAFRRVLPGARFVDLEPSHPIFHSFYEINSFDIVPQMYDVGRPVFRGVFEDNDPNKRLLAMINFNTDISEYWEFSGTGLLPISETNEAYKLGINYIVYGLTH
jgi:hypothetical protein